MTDLENCRGHAVVVQPDEGASFWQPVPANGHADPKLVPANTHFSNFSMGYQTVAAGSHIRSHAHSDQVELQICFGGKGHVLVDGQRHELVPGTACFLGPDVVHEIFADEAEDLVQLWVIRPAGLEDFFAAIGRVRQPGEAPPVPFERPGAVASIERAMGFDQTETS